VTDAATPKKGGDSAPAFYARPRFLSSARSRDWWAILHPPYTAWHLATVVIGACLAPEVHTSRMLVSVLAFFLAVGLAAHTLDELQGRPLRTSISTRTLIAVAIFGLVGASSLGVVGAVVVSPYLVIFIVAGVTLALGYNLELFGGVLHSDLMFALSWGGFPVVTAGFAEDGRLTVSIVIGAVMATALAGAQRALSTPARRLRRRTSDVRGVIEALDGSTEELSVTTLLAPLEVALRLLSAMVVVLAVTFVAIRFHW
jgi:hypothetical protein